jgi:hypothetical protein
MGRDDVSLSVQDWVLTERRRANDAPRVPRRGVRQSSDRAAPIARLAPHKRHSDAALGPRITRRSQGGSGGAWALGALPTDRGPAVRDANQVRIHLDEVSGLGSFIELEAVAPPESDLAGEYLRIAALREALGITSDRLVAASYSDELMRTCG